MKITTPVFLTLLTSIGVSSSPIVADNAPHNQLQIAPVTLTDSQANGYMDAIVVEDFDIHQTKLSSALQHLDEVVEPYNLQILFKESKGKDPVVSLKTRDLSLSRNLSYLCRQVGYDWWVEEGVVIVGAPGSNEAMVTEVIPLRSTTASRLVKIQSVRN